MVSSSILQLCSQIYYTIILYIVWKYLYKHKPSVFPEGTQWQLHSCSIHEHFRVTVAENCLSHGQLHTVEYCTEQFMTDQ